MMQIEKITLSLNRELLEKLAKKANMSRSEYVRGLITREASKSDLPFEISKEIMELQGCLGSSENSSKSRIHNSALKKLRNYEH
jgi:metal-responsive CopG/Arc/MetJ family transcriptional regulator